nr:PH domain-containing protein [Prevotella histicola]
MLDMLNNEFIPFQTVTIRPHWGQFCINEFPGILLCIAGYWVSRFTDFVFHDFFIWPSLFLTIYLFFQIVYMARIEYVLTAEQLITLHGVLSHSTDYIELYRVIDYQQHQSLPQQLFGLKTITIYSGDRNNPKLNMIGIKARLDIVGEIRKRVEFNKKRKGIYEITNRS